MRLTTKKRHLGISVHPAHKLQRQNGTGLYAMLESARTAVENAKPFVLGLHEAYTGETANAIRNALPAADHTARPGFPGELHAIQRLPNGALGVSNFTGPGTNILARVLRKDPPRTLTDKTSKAHDLRYTFAKNTDDIRAADRKMLSTLNQLEAKGMDSKFNTIPARVLIRAKTLAEDADILSRSAFMGKKGHYTQAEQDAMMLDLHQLTQEGYGALPGEKLKLKLLQERVAMGLPKDGAPPPSSRAKGSRAVKGLATRGLYDEVPPTKGSGRVMRGLGMKGTSDDVAKYVATKVLPDIIAKVGLSAKDVPTALMTNIIAAHLHDTNPKTIDLAVASIARILVPILVQAMVHRKTKEKTSIADAIAAVSKKRAPLEKSIHASLAHLIDAKKTGGQAGSGFTQELDKFLGVINPIVDVVAKVAPIAIKLAPLFV